MSPVLTPDPRAEALGQQVGRFAADTVHRLRALAAESLPQNEGDRPGSVGERPAERAEYLVNSIETTAASYSRALGYRLRRVLARAREEVEDIVAEAQSQRSGERPEQPARDKELVTPS